jgi:endonuclease YncB( thermonuclease family)
MILSFIQKTYHLLIFFTYTFVALDPTFSQTPLKNTRDKLSWVTLQNCKLVDNPNNDGDSFHVSHKGKTRIVRLYLVDTPETILFDRGRINEQASFFNATREKTLLAGFLATTLTTKLLKSPFTVVTKGEDAKGMSKGGREYAIVTTGNREDLARILLEHGLARSYGKLPENTAKFLSLRGKYDQIQERAKRRGYGNWGPKELKLPPNSPLKKADIDTAQREVKKLLGK